MGENVTNAEEGITGEYFICDEGLEINGLVCERV